MKAKITDLIDFEKVNTLLEGFNKSTGFVTAILDLDGNVLSKSGWRQICTEFHRINLETSKRCTISDTLLAGKLAKGEKYHFYKCLNGLVDVAVPIIIKGEHIANLFSGQFFFEKPDVSFFRNQAKKYKFNEEIYLKVLMDVPVVSEEKVKTVMDFLLNMTQMISEMTFQRLEQMELNEALSKSEERWHFAIEGNNDGLWEWNIETDEVFFSKQWKKMLGYEENEIENNFNEWEKRVHPDDKRRALDLIQNYLNNKIDSYSLEYQLQCKDRTYKWIESRGKIMSYTNDGRPLRFIGTHTDITIRKNAEKEIQDLSRFPSENISPVLRVEPGGIILYANEASSQLLSVWEREVGQTIPDDLMEHLTLTLKTESNKEIEIKCNSKIFSLIFVPIIKEGYVNIYGRDITERIQADIALRESNEKLQVILENSPIAIWDWNIKTDNWYATPKYYTMLGYEPEVGNPDRSVWLNRIHPDDRESVRTKIENVLNHANENYRYDARMLHADGTYRWQKVIGNVIDRDANGKAIRMLGVRIDINESKMAEEALRKSEERFSLINDSSRDSIYSYDRNGRFTSVNRSLCKALNLRPDQIIGHTHAELGFPETLCDKWDKLHQQVYKTNNTIVSETYAPEGGGSIHYYEVMLNPLHDNMGNIIGIGGSTKDITDRKLAEDEIKKLNKELELRVKQRTAQLEAANKELETFTYSVSHDLKAPLRGIDGYSKLLLDLYGRILDEEGQLFLNIIRSSTMQMNQLIDDLLEYSRLERSPMRNETIKIQDLTNSVSSIFNEELHTANFVLKVEVPDISLIADSKGLHIALRNLLENAIKFTKGKPNPQIEIGLEEKTSGWLLYVKDNGIGFDMKYHQRIFEIFQRLHRAEDFPGTGIGLAMVSKAMHRMQGNVWAESTLGVGSTFFLEIPKLS